ncbi:MAG: hypothetical protein O2822_00470 [Chloroflexi bacterium]|nr:hypothetical protein [Chloroflexota bacterium]
MDLDPDEHNPMWAARIVLARSSHGTHRGAAPDPSVPAVRIALPMTEVRALLDEQRGADCVTQVVMWDSPLMLLADDVPLADRLRAHGLTILVRGGTYAERQWDAREALEEVAHRFYDHQEEWGVRGMTTRQPRFTVAVVQGAPQIRALVGGLMRHGASAGLVIDARDPIDLRVFVVDALDADRVILVRPDHLEEHPRGAIVRRMMDDLVSGEEPRRA